MKSHTGQWDTSCARQVSEVMPVLTKSTKPTAVMFADDGSIPNNPKLPFLLYRGAIDNFKFPEDSDYQAYLEPAIASFLAGQPIARQETASFGCAIQSVYYILPNPL